MTSEGEELVGWFDGIARFCDSTLFAVAQDERHRRAAVLDVLMRNARLLDKSEVDESGVLYQPAAFVLAAASKYTRTVPNPGHWGAALENVRNLRLQLTLASIAPLGLDPGTAASIFKDHFTEALIQAGVTGHQSQLDETNRQLALALSINWGMRFLLAYSLETVSPARHDSSPRDLGWLHDLASRDLATAPVSSALASE